MGLTGEYTRKGVREWVNWSLSHVLNTCQVVLVGKGLRTSQENLSIVASIRSKLGTYHITSFKILQNEEVGVTHLTDDRTETY